MNVEAIPTRLEAIAPRLEVSTTGFFATTKGLTIKRNSYVYTPLLVYPCKRTRIGETTVRQPKEVKSNTNMHPNINCFY